jgi:hypothetical protein
MNDIRKILDLIEDAQTEPEVGDVVEIELGDTLIETTISDVTEDGVVIYLDETGVRLMIDAKKALNESEKSDEDDEDDYDPYESMTDRELIRMMRQEGRGKSCVIDGEGQLANRDEVIEILKQDEEISEAEYQGRKVQLGKPMAGDVKKSKVYVKGPKGNVVKVNFGDKKMRIKKSNPNRRKSFRARHNCDNPGPRWKARYWSCRAW